MGWFSMTAFKRVAVMLMLCVYFVQDIMCQVFAEMGLGSITTLHDFYQTRILHYHENMVETCQQLSQEYNKLKHPLENKQETFTLIKCVLCSDALKFCSQTRADVIFEVVFCQYIRQHFKHFLYHCET